MSGRLAMKRFLHLLSSLRLQISATLEEFTFGCMGLCRLSTTLPTRREGSRPVCAIKSENPRTAEMAMVLNSARYPSSYRVLHTNIADSGLNSTAI